MKHIGITALIVAVVFVSLNTHVWAGGMRFGGGGRGGHFGGSHFSRGFGHSGGFRGGLRHHGPQARFGSPHRHHHGFGHHKHFHHEQFFGPHHHSGPFAPFGHQHHFKHEQFHGHHQHFGHHSFPFHSFGFSGRSFFFNDRFGPAGPPPLGAPGLTPFVPLGPSTVIIRAPFFCRPHRFEFTDQTLFVEHLAQFHGIPSESAFSFCWPVGGGNRWIFFGF